MEKKTDLEKIVLRKVKFAYYQHFPTQLLYQLDAKADPYLNHYCHTVAMSFHAVVYGKSKQATYKESCSIPDGWFQHLKMDLNKILGLTLPVKYNTIEYELTINYWAIFPELEPIKDTHVISFGHQERKSYKDGQNET